MYKRQPLERGVPLYPPYEMSIILYNVILICLAFPRVESLTKCPIDTLVSVRFLLANQNVYCKYSAGGKHPRDYIVAIASNIGAIK